MRSMKLVVLVAVFALSAIGAANASAASTFTASATGNLVGSGGLQKFHTNGGTVECQKDDASGIIESTASTNQHATVKYTECSAFGFTAHVSDATYTFTANGEVHLKNTVTITVTGGIFGECTVTVGPQTLSGISYDNSSPIAKITVTALVKNIVYTSTGGICGSSGSNGEYTGNTVVERETSGTVSWDA